MPALVNYTHPIQHHFFSDYAYEEFCDFIWEYCDVDFDYDTLSQDKCREIAYVIETHHNEFNNLLIAKVLDATCWINLLRQLDNFKIV